MAEGNIVVALLQVIDSLLSIYMYIILAAAVVSWLNLSPYNPAVKFLHAATEPVLRPIRRHLPLWGGVDFSPLVAIFAIVIIKKLLVAAMINSARGFR